MQSTIGPEMKVHIKGVTNETTKLVDMKTNGFARNRKLKVSDHFGIEHENHQQNLPNKIAKNEPKNPSSNET